MLIVIGNWLVNIGRADIAFSVNQLSRFNESPREVHLKLATRIFEYLHKFPNRSVFTEEKDQPHFMADLEAKKITAPGDMKSYYKDSLFENFPYGPKPYGEGVEINIFIDSSHGDNKVDRKSTTGFVAFVGDMLYKVKSKRQKTVATSTFSAEFMALRYAVEEAISLKYLLQSLGVKVKGPAKIYSDSKSVLDSATILGTDLKRKHVALAFHAVREENTHDIVSLYKIDAKENIADVFTKNLGRLKFHYHAKRLYKNYQDESKV